MKDGGYTYTTICGQPHEPTRIQVAFYLDDQARIGVYGQDTGRPFLSIAHGDVQASVHPAPDEVTAQDVHLARTLADQAAAYATEVERAHTAAQARAEADAAA